jgi:hypothetical protein
MPLLLRMIYKNSEGNVVTDFGPKELYLPKVHSPSRIRLRKVMDLIEADEDFEKSDWSKSDEYTVEWEVITSYVS